MRTFKFNPMTGMLDLVDSLAVGDIVQGGTPDSVLYIGADGAIAETNPGFTFDKTDFKINADITLTTGKKLYFDG